MNRPSGDLVTDLAQQGLAEIQVGAVAAVMVKGDRLWTIVRGEVRPGQAATAATPFHICSCSKTFTAATFARLVQEGVVDWDGLARDIVPEFLLPDTPLAALCTFRDLAAMRVGTGRAGVAEWGIRQDIPVSERLAHGRHIAPAAPFRDRFSYSNLSYIALALAAERLAGRPYADLVQDLVCRPLGMAHTASIGGSQTPPADAAEPQMPFMGRMISVRELTGPNSEGSARIYLPADDAATWLRSLLSALRGPDQAPWSGVVRDMARPWSLSPAADERQAPEGDGWAAYGMGLAISRLRDGRLLRHSGGGRGWRHAMAMAPNQDAGVMVLAAAETPAIEGLALELLEALAWGEARSWRPMFMAAAARAARVERTMVDAGFPPGPTEGARLRPGLYGNAASGEVRIEAVASGLRMIPDRAPDLVAGLRPVGPDVFELDFHEPSLSRQPLDPPFRLRAAIEDGQSVLHTTYFGALRPVA